MAAPRKKAAAAAPASEAAPGQVRAKASRMAFRRGGMVFGDREWTVIPSELPDADKLAILAEPVLTIQVNGPDGWVTMTSEDRAAAFEAASKAATKD
ncbi:hypothetical protein [Brevundimonas sp.]|uniref:hypothetical protein n=1 Tax=Brevundimonas sp. TaxID=1871086 RepID=UPI003517D3C2